MLKDAVNLEIVFSLHEIVAVTQKLILVIFLEDHTIMLNISVMKKDII